MDIPKRDGEPDSSPAKTELGESLDLMRRAQQGQADALSRLLERYQERILRVVRARMGPELRRRTESVDVMQQVLITATRCYDRFDVTEESSLVHWLARIIENEVMRQADHFRRAKRSRHREEDLPDRGLPGASPAPSAIARASEQSSRLEEALDQLTRRQRELILQRDYLGGSWSAIANDLGYSTAESARVSHSRAILALGKILRSESPE